MHRNPETPAVTPKTLIFNTGLVAGFDMVCLIFI